MLTPLEGEQADWNGIVCKRIPTQSAVKPFVRVASYSHKTKEEPLSFVCSRRDLSAHISALCLSLGANSQSEIIMAVGQTSPVVPAVLAFSHAPRQSPNIHTQTRPHINATLEAGRLGGFCALLLLGNGTALQPQPSSRAHLSHSCVSEYRRGSLLEVTLPLLIFMGRSFTYLYVFCSFASLQPRHYSVFSACLQTYS